MPALTFRASANFALAKFLAFRSFGNVSVRCRRFAPGRLNETYQVPRDLLAMRPSRGLGLSAHDPILFGRLPQRASCSVVWDDWLARRAQLPGSMPPSLPTTPPPRARPSEGGGWGWACATVVVFQLLAEQTVLEPRAICIHTVSNYQSMNAAGASHEGLGGNRNRPRSRSRGLWSKR